MMPIKKSESVRTSTPRFKKSSRFKGPIGAQAIVLVAIGVMAAVVMLIAGTQSSQSSDVTAGDKIAAGRARSKNAAPEAAVLDTTLASGANMPAAESSAMGPVQKLAPVTMTGCLELTHETFRLSDTTGVDAPKSRSWKSGFLKKGSASIEVVDAAKRLQLPSHVGQRVSVTGTLVDREMQVRSLKRIAATCKPQTVAKL
jgi:hypothetical protein